MSDKEVNPANSRLLTGFTDVVWHKILKHTDLLFFLLCPEVL